MAEIKIQRKRSPALWPILLLLLLALGWYALDGRKRMAAQSEGAPPAVQAPARP